MWKKLNLSRHCLTHSCIRSSGSRLSLPSTRRHQNDEQRGQYIFEHFYYFMIALVRVSMGRCVGHFIIIIQSVDNLHIALMLGAHATLHNITQFHLSHFLFEFVFIFLHFFLVSLCFRIFPHLALCSHLSAQKFSRRSLALAALFVLCTHVQCSCRRPTTKLQSFQILRHEIVDETNSHQRAKARRIYCFSFPFCIFLCGIVCPLIDWLVNMVQSWVCLRCLRVCQTPKCINNVARAETIFAHAQLSSGGWRAHSFPSIPTTNRESGQRNPE